MLDPGTEVIVAVTGFEAVAPDVSMTRFGTSASMGVQVIHVRQNARAPNAFSLPPVNVWSPIPKASR